MKDRGKHAAAALPGSGYRRPDILSANSLRVGPLTGEDGEDLGTYDFSSLLEDCPRSLLEDLVQGFATAAGPGGRWRTASSVRRGASTTRSVARSIASSHTGVSSIRDVTPEVYSCLVEMFKEPSAPDALTNALRLVLLDTLGLPASTRRALYAPNRSKRMRRAAAAKYSRAEFRRIRSAARRHVVAAEARILPNIQDLSQFRDGLEPPDCMKFELADRTWTKGELLDFLARTGVMPPSLAVSKQRVRRLVHKALGLARRQQMPLALYLSSREARSLAILIACERGWNASSIFRIDLARVSRADDRTTGHPVYTVELEKPRRAKNRYESETLAGRQAASFERAVSLTQPARDTLENLGHPTSLLLVARASGRTRHPTGLFITSLLDIPSLSRRWNQKVHVPGNDNKVPRVDMRLLRSSWQGLRRRSTQNTQDVHERDYIMGDALARATAMREVEQGELELVAEADETMARRIDAAAIAALRDDPAAVPGLTERQAVDLVTGRLDTDGGFACLDIMHSPHEEDCGGRCTMSFLLCVVCPLSVSTPDHIPMQLAVVDVLEGAAAAVHGTAREGEFDLHVVRHKSVLRKWTPAELEHARSRVTASHHDAAERLLQREFDV